MTIRVCIYQTADGKQPFTTWLHKLKDRGARSRLRARLARVQLGNLGDCRHLGTGLLELRIDHGPGYRIYLARFGSDLALLLCGGDKRTQQQDIRLARTFMDDYRKRTRP